MNRFITKYRNPLDKQWRYYSTGLLTSFYSTYSSKRYLALLPERTSYVPLKTQGLGKNGQPCIKKIYFKFCPRLKWTRPTVWHLAQLIHTIKRVAGTQKPPKMEPKFFSRRQEVIIIAFPPDRDFIISEKLTNWEEPFESNFWSLELGFVSWRRGYLTLPAIFLIT